MVDLLRLPLEIRRMIYRELFIHQGHFSIALLGTKSLDPLRPDPDAPSSSRGSPLNLLQTSRAVRAEAWETIWREAEFNLSFYFGLWGNSTQSVDALFRRVGRAQTSRMRHVCWNETHVEVARVVVGGAQRLFVSAKTMAMVRRLLRRLPHLRLCEVWCSGDGYRDSTWRLPGHAVHVLPQGGAGRQRWWPALGSMYSITFVAGVPGTASGRCSAYWKGWHPRF